MNSSTAAQERANGGAHSLGQTEGHRIDAAPILRRLDPQRYRCVEDPRPIHMDFEVIPMCGRGHRLHLGRTPRLADAHVVGVLDAEEPRERQVRVVGGTDELVELIRFDDSVFRFDWPHNHPCDVGVTTRFPVVDVAVLLGDYLVAQPRMRQDGARVSHGAGSHQRCCLRTHGFSRQLFEAVHRRIFAVTVVPELRVPHRLPHLLGRQRDGVASQVDDSP